MKKYKLERGKLKIVKKASERAEIHDGRFFGKTVEVAAGCMKKIYTFVNGECVDVREEVLLAS